MDRPFIEKSVWWYRLGSCINYPNWYLELITNQVVRALEGDVSLSDLNEGIRPGNSRVYGSYGSSDYDTSQYNEDMKKFRKMALGSQEYGASSEYSGPTSEYGLYPSGSSSEGQNTREMEMGKMKKASKGFSGSSWQLTALIFCKDPSLLLLVLIGRHIDCKNGMFWMWKHIQFFFFLQILKFRFYYMYLIVLTYKKTMKQLGWFFYSFFKCR